MYLFHLKSSFVERSAERDLLGTEMKLQLAFDLHSSNGVFKLVEGFADLIDVIEFGTPLIIKKVLTF